MPPPGNPTTSRTPLQSVSDQTRSLSPEEAIEVAYRLADDLATVLPPELGSAEVNGTAYAKLVENGRWSASRLETITVDGVPLSPLYPQSDERSALQRAQRFIADFNDIVAAYVTEAMARTADGLGDRARDLMILVGTEPEVTTPPEFESRRGGVSASLGRSLHPQKDADGKPQLYVAARDGADYVTNALRRADRLGVTCESFTGLHQAIVDIRDADPSEIDGAGARLALAIQATRAELAPPPALDSFELERSMVQPQPPSFDDGLRRLGGWVWKGAENRTHAEQATALLLSKMSDFAKGKDFTWKVDNRRYFGRFHNGSLSVNCRERHLVAVWNNKDTEFNSNSSRLTNEDLHQFLNDGLVGLNKLEIHSSKVQEAITRRQIGETSPVMALRGSRNEASVEPSSDLRL